MFRLLLLGVALVGLAGSPGCRREKQKALDSYSVEGVVRAISSGTGSARQMVILHQAIPSFRDREGKVVGMMSMPMPFSIADELDISKYKIGDKVAFTFEIAWQEQIPTRITALIKLPDDHQIIFSGQ